MKVVLLKDVKGVGRAHEAIEARDGHALNYLIPQKLAIAATAAALKEAQARQKQVTERKELDTKLLAQNIAALADARLVIKAKANEKGHLYDAVGESEISAAAKEQAKVDLPVEAIKIDRPFKELGTFDIPVAAGETFGTFSITIEAE
ncbi:50S ribosomal protein L9 [Candidatus Kaiserbacteria bacterium RIFCSPLOWO2_02_FULL_54_13]|uniref:Large ribosomal subunit protein bL9 n=1 Tax=Candidatus Kaiserbacteria bacterium RIFCSPHIGHO2_02_FULL_54_22 TaxID=1798495 RepID=A0A1F6DMJ0_9BACT|nr:MAG: 50S ribosomal protein L9 [Parcubacteria group bacterium GW2011_GWB1_55_9]OGG62648.1 MAG: 50S ribosomal protein L9 [Candidatus Kaiserbacteria bacterium RIFCSPHIGHO2_02_FULL_54_22]OGG68226.1 MAG: 50S ribosomal protein L9 [Candidatus Kaiserbacteria bacterium RIFCSPHIGHO2_12_FULL_54_16]OGG82820.1 MAG: 50S ribosomal protein L9 [Candidatus Kaiserbacteria bacterium RIFCSPLOWO2_02_FULL_54_13]OGG90534.1 MAG: 50S ribosomal protein L9 [Candidatus Kaiserbacteria bacterium RIFCSPLOWO2_12_FULL_54_10]